MKFYFNSEETIYTSTCGKTIKREIGQTPNGNPLNNKWVFRDENGTFIDFDKYRNDLAERNDFVLVRQEDPNWIDLFKGTKPVFKY